MVRSGLEDGSFQMDNTIQALLLITNQQARASGFSLPLETNAKESTLKLKKKLRLMDKKSQ